MFATYIYYSEINQYGYLVHEVTMFMDMNLNGEMWRKANHKMTGIGRFFGVQISQISESDQSFCDFSYTNTLASVSPRIHCIWIPLWHLFFREQYTFILQTSSDVIDLTGAFYQKILLHILNGNFVLNKGN